MRLRLTVLFVIVSAVAVPGTASASEIIDRNANDVSLKVAQNGQALVSYTARGKRWNVLAWGALNAMQPTPAGKQVEFKIDYSGGYGTYKKDVWKTFKNACREYDGPELQWFVAGCKAADGSYWALQSWQRMLPNYGVAPTATQSVWELRLSHWTGELPELTISTDWAWHQWDHLFGTFTYAGSPVFGYKATPAGNPLDSFGRNIYVDTFNSTYGKGWKRENSFLTHTNTGVFCYSFNPHGAHPAGKGAQYRATVEGPGVTPDVMWQGTSPGAYDHDADLAANDAISQLGDKQCRGN
jgi:hypothetical protein